MHFNCWARLLLNIFPYREGDNPVNLLRVSDVAALVKQTKQLLISNLDHRSMKNQVQDKQKKVLCMK